MTVFFRPYGDIKNAPATRSSFDLDLYDYLSEKTGITVAHDPEIEVDYENWMEPAKMLEAALRAGYEVKILPKAKLRQAVMEPLAVIPGLPSNDILIGRQNISDMIEIQYLNFAWPAACENLANHYAELPIFQMAAGRKAALANMPGEPNHRERKLPEVKSGWVDPFFALGSAIRSFEGGECIVKQVYPAKSLPLQHLQVAPDLSNEACERLFTDKVGLHIARFEGDQGSLLVQEKVQMTHETRFFVINHKVVCGAACIESDTPAVNIDNERVLARFEVVRNSGNIIHDRNLAKIFEHFVEYISEEVRKEAPSLAHYVIDVALGANDKPLVIEMNPASSSGLYGNSTDALFRAIIKTAQAGAATAASLGLPGFTDTEAEYDDEPFVD